MSKDSKEHLLEYYQRELTYLRRRGSEFAKQYPKVAGRLELGVDGSPDPHIERLLESFAFLTARIQYNLESEFPLLSTALLGVLYPQFLSPVPPMSVARFELDPTQVKLTTAYTIAKHTSLKTRQGECRFRTCYPVELWPAEVSSAEFISPDKFDFIGAGVSTVLRLNLSSQGEPFSNLIIPRLRFYLNGDRILVNTLYEHIFSNVVGIAVAAGGKDKPLLRLPADAILPVGFRTDEDVLPYPPNAHPAYRLLHEYFTFPEKFLFFDLDFQKHGGNLPGSLPPDTTSFDILFMMDQMPKTSLAVDKNTFCLGCTPIINLFPKTTEPMRIDERHAEYLLIPDQRREKTTEIHSILSVSSVSESDDASGTLSPFFSFTHRMDKEDSATLAFWQSRREPTGRKDVPGTQMFLSFVDLGFNPAVPPAKTVFAHTLCTNRNLAEEVPVGAMLQIEKNAPVSDIFTLGKPTPRIDPPMEGAALWRLISHLSLNYLSLGESADSLKALQEILRLYDISEHSDTSQQIAGIKEMSCRKVVRRIGNEAWRGFCRGIEITVTFNEREYVGTGAFLFASVLNSFFPLYTSVNSFTRLVIKSEQRKGVWKEWPPMVGEQMVL